MAALTVNELERRDARAHVPAFINFCGPSVERAPTHLRDLLQSTHVRAPSVHILGRADEQFTHAELLSLPGVCQHAVSMWHARGHVVPPATDMLVGAILHAAQSVEIHPRETAVDIPPVAVASLWPQGQGSSESESEPEDDAGEHAGGRLLGAGKRASIDGGRTVSDSLSLLRIGKVTKLSELECVRGHIGFFGIVLVLQGHSHLHHIANRGAPFAAPSVWNLLLFVMIRVAYQACNVSFIILLGAKPAPKSWRELGWFLASIICTVYVAMFSGFDEAAENWFWADHQVHLCFAGSRRYAVHEMMELSWSSQDELACLPPLDEARGPFLSALWFLIAYIGWQCVRFVALRLGVAKWVFPVAVCYALFAGRHALADGNDWPFSLFVEGEMYARALAKRAPQMWWVFALGTHLPTDFPLRLPGEGLRLRALNVEFLFTRRRTRAFWVVAILIAAACTPFNDGVLIALKGCGDLGSGKCSAAATAALALARLAKMCLQVIGAFGACAMMPTRLTPLTHAGRDSIVILLLNGYLLALFKVPLTLATLFARERFGGFTMQATWVGICTLLALGAHNVASAVLRPVGIIVADATVHVRSGRRTKAVIRVLPLACMLIAVWLFIRTTNAPLPPAVPPARPRSHVYLRESTLLSPAARRDARVREKQDARGLKKALKKVSKHAPSVHARNGTVKLARTRSPHRKNVTSEGALAKNATRANYYRARKASKLLARLRARKGNETGRMRTKVLEALRTMPIADAPRAAASHAPMPVRRKHFSGNPPAVAAASALDAHQYARAASAGASPKPAEGAAGPVRRGGGDSAAVQERSASGEKARPASAHNLSRLGATRERRRERMRDGEMLRVGKQHPAPRHKHGPTKESSESAQWKGDGEVTM
jgi:hypothetical protein